MLLRNTNSSNTQLQCSYKHNNAYQYRKAKEASNSKAVVMNKNDKESGGMSSDV